MRPGLKRKLAIKLARTLATVATTTLSFLTVSTENPAIAGAVNFDSRHLEKMLSVKIVPNQMGISSGDNLVSLGQLNEPQPEAQKNAQTDNLKIAIPFGIAALTNDEMDVEPLRNSSVDVNQPVALIKDPASGERLKYRGEYTDNPNFFETVIFSISLVGSVMTLTPIIIVKRQIKSYLE
jgi:hypothetical protein